MSHANHALDNSETTRSRATGGRATGARSVIEEGGAAAAAGTAAARSTAEDTKASRRRRTTGAAGTARTTTGAGARYVYLGVSCDHHTQVCNRCQKPRPENLAPREGRGRGFNERDDASDRRAHGEAHAVTKSSPGDGQQVEQEPRAKVAEDLRKVVARPEVEVGGRDDSVRRAPDLLGEQLGQRRLGVLGQLGDLVLVGEEALHHRAPAEPVGQPRQLVGAQVELREARVATVPV